MAGAADRGRGPEDVFGDLARSYLFGRFAESTSKSYSGNWRMWCAWREMIGKASFMERSLGEVERAEELAAYMAYCASEKKNKETTIGSKLVAVNFYHMQYRGMKLPLDSPYIKGVRQGIKGKQVEAGTEQRIRRPMTWGMLTEM